MIPPKRITINQKRTAAARPNGRTLLIDTPRVFLPLLSPSRYKGAYGGRGSGKSHFFAELLIEECLCQRGMLAVCIREVQKSLKDSSKRLIEVKLRQLGLGEADGFKVFEKQIQTPGDGVIVFCGMQESNAENIKSLEGFRVAWVEEAQALSHRSLALLRPTIRAKDSQIWASWNPRRKGDAIDDFLRAKRPRDAVVVEVNWRDNPWFPAVLEEERLTDLRLYPDRYDHGWAVILMGSAKLPISAGCDFPGAAWISSPLSRTGVTVVSIPAWLWKRTTSRCLTPSARQQNIPTLALRPLSTKRQSRITRASIRANEPPHPGLAGWRRPHLLSSGP